MSADSSQPIIRTQMFELSNFTGDGYNKGRSRLVCALWMTVSSTVFRAWWCPSRVRVLILRAFGARIGTEVLIRHRVRIHWPWKLSVGSNVWIGEGVWILNLEPVEIGSNVCVSQDVMLCTGSHDFYSHDFHFDNGSIVIEDSTWLALKVVVLRGVTIGKGSLVGACALVAKSLPPASRVAAAASVTAKGSVN